MKHRSNVRPERNNHACRLCLALTSLALSGLLATACWAQPRPTDEPQVELQARSVDGMDLLAALARLTPFNFVAVRNGHPRRIDVPPRPASMGQLRNDIIARAGMKRVERGGTEIVVNACRLPLNSGLGVTLEHDEPIAMYFNRVAPEEFFALMARILKLELRAPDGLPKSDLALVIRSQRTSGLLATIDSVLSLESHVEGKHLVVRKRAGSRPCSTTGDETWQASVPTAAALERSLDEFLRRATRQIAGPCKRLASFPETAQEPCRYLEHFALRDLSIKGYIKLTRNSPYGVLIEPPAGSFLERAYVGDKLGEQFGVISAVNSQEVSIIERSGHEPAGAVETLTRISFQSGESRSTPASPAVTDTARRLITPNGDLDHYDLEDLAIRSEKTNGAWEATVRDPFGVDHVVRAHDSMGTNDGTITKITAAEIHLEEIVPNKRGGFMTKDTILVPGVRYEDPRRALIRKYAAPISGSTVQTEFIGAAARGDERRLQQLAGLGANIDAADGYERDNALVASIVSRKSNVVAWLLGNGAKANILVGGWEETPLHVAASLGDLGIAQQLLAAHADVNLRDRHDRTAIVQAVVENHGSMVALLVAKGADLKSWDDLGLAPFTRAAHRGQTDVIRLLLNNGVTIDDRDGNGYTLLSAAVQGGKRQLVATLIGLGSDVNSVSQWGESVLDLARGEKTDPEIVELLVSHGARSAKLPTDRNTSAPSRQP